MDNNVSDVTIYTNYNIGDVTCQGGKMATDKKKLQIYLKEETYENFRIISALNGMKMSEYGERIIEELIEKNKYIKEIKKIEER